jgi:hypothetical protein
LTLALTSQEKTKSQIASVQDMTKESQLGEQKEAVLLKVDELGYIDNGTGKHQSNIVYSADGICPCQYAVQHKEPFKVME